jgi:hypothetical protein
VKKKAQNNKLKKSQATLPKQDPQFQAFNYKNLKNNYLYKLPTKPADLNYGDTTLNTVLRDHATPE